MSERSISGERRSNESSHWDHLWKTATLESWDSVSQDVYEALISAVGDLNGLRILEAGSGSGRISLRLAQDGAQVTLLDFSEAALAESKRRFGMVGLDGLFLHGSIEAIPAPDNTFDVVWSAGVLEHYTPSEQVRMLREMARVLKPGGQVITLVPHAGCILYRVYKAALEATGTWPFGMEVPLATLLPQSQEAGLEVETETSVGFETACQLAGSVPGGALFASYARFFYQQAAMEERSLFPGYLLVSVSRKPGGGHRVRVEPQSDVVPAGDRRTIVLLSSCDWGYLWQRPQQMAVQLTRLGHRVVFVNSTSLRMSIPEQFDEGRLRARICHAVIQQTTWERGVAVTSPVGTLRAANGTPIPAGSLWLEVMLETLGIEHPIFWVVGSQWGSHIASLRRLGFVVYDCVDELSGFTGVTPAVLHSARHLEEGAQMISVTARSLADSRRQRYSRVHHIPNAVNPEEYDPWRKRAVSRLWKSPVIGFLGALANWVDYPLIAELARSHPEWTFVLAGSAEGGDLGPISNLPNVVLPGRIPYEQVPLVLGQFDVGMIPFVVNELTHNANPIKVYEYLASGLPVVATGFQEMESFGDLVEVADGAGAFAEAIEKALAARRPEDVAKRLAYVQRHTWRRMADIGAALASAYDWADRGDLEAAGRTLAGALQRCGDDEDLRTEVLSAMAHIGLMDQLADELGGTPESLDSFIQVLVGSGAKTAALRVALHEVQRFPSHADARYNCALIQTELGQFAQALANWVLLLLDHSDRSAIPMIAAVSAEWGYGEIAQEWANLVDVESLSDHQLQVALEHLLPLLVDASPA